MRYLHSQKIVTALIEHVFADQLTTVDFSLGDPATHYFYLRGQRFRADSWGQAQTKGQKFLAPYRLDNSTAGLDPDSLFKHLA